MFGLPYSGYRFAVLLCAHLDSLNIYTRHYMEWFNYLDSNLCWADVDISIDEETLTGNYIIGFPNPFASSIIIRYEFKAQSKILLTIYNSIGNVVYSFKEHLQPPGYHTVSWSPSHLPKGLYYGVLRSEEGVSVVKLVKQ